MKSKRFIGISLLLLGCMSLTGCDWPWNKKPAEEQKITPAQTNTTSKYDLKEYYKSITTQEGDDLLNALHSLINTSSVSTSYAWSRFEAADEDPNDKYNIITIYARTSLSKSAHVSGNKGWNREHTYPQSKLPSEQARNDTHIIFASDYAINEKRSSYKLGVLTTGSTLKDSYGHDTTCRLGKVFDPNNIARGITARATMYAAAMYDLIPTNNFESIETMLKWHLTYQVNQNDMNRNDTVYGFQHNRNPFVDHPEYACKIWGGSNQSTMSACKAAGYSY